MMDLLTFKVLMIMALNTAQQVMTLQELNLDRMIGP